MVKRLWRGRKGIKVSSSRASQDDQIMVKGLWRGRKGIRITINMIVLRLQNLHWSGIGSLKVRKVSNIRERI